MAANNFREANLALLAEHKPDTYSKVKDLEVPEDIVLIPTPSGSDTMRLRSGEDQWVLAYNNQNPWDDVRSHFETVTPDARGLVLFIGMGLGYGPLLILRDRPGIDRIGIIEPSAGVFAAALAATDLSALIVSPRVEFFIGELDLEVFERSVARIAALEDTRILRQVPSFAWKPEQYESLSDKVYMLVNKINAGGGTTRKCGSVFFRNRLENLSMIRHCSDLDALKGLFKGKPAVLVAAGPSLDRSLADLKKVSGRCVLIAADSALAPLLAAGITPDFVTSIDFLDLNFEKVAPYLNRELPFTFVTLIKCAPLVLKRFPARQTVLAFPEDRPHAWIIDSLGLKTLSAGALSVAHLSLGVALVMEADPIFFVGQDLSYTTQEDDHAENTIIKRSGLPRDMEIFHVKAIDGGRVATDRQLMSLQKQFEDIIAVHPRTYFNASAAGVHIEGTSALSLNRAFEKHFPGPLPVGDIVRDTLAGHKGFAVGKLARECGAVLGKVRKAQAAVNDSREVAAKGIREIRKLIKEGYQARDLNDLPREVLGLMVRFDGINSGLDSNPVMDHVIELTYGVLSDNDRLRIVNDEIRAEEGYLPWLLAELERIDLVNKSRVEALTFYREILGSLEIHLGQEKKLTAGSGKKKKDGTDSELLELYLKSGDYVPARRVFESLPENRMAEPGILLIAGEIYAGMLDFETADRFWNKALETDGTLSDQIASRRARHIDTWVAFGDRYGNEEETGDNFLHLLPVWLGRVRALVRGEVPGSLASLWEKHRQKITGYLASGETSTAARILDSWEGMEEIIPEISTLRAESCGASVDLGGAVGEIEQRLAADPANPVLLARSARALLDSGRFDEGLARLREAVAIDPAQAVLWEELGDLLMNTGDFASAASAYEQCFLAIPARIISLRKMGDSYLRQGRPEAAAVAYEAVLGKDPQNKEAKALLEKALELSRGKEGGGRVD